MNMQEQIDSINRIINDMDRLDEIRKLKDHNNQVKLNQTTMDDSFKRLKKRGYKGRISLAGIQARTIILFDYLLGKEMNLERYPSFKRATMGKDKQCYNCKKIILINNKENVVGYMIMKWELVYNSEKDSYTSKVNEDSVLFFCIDCFKRIAPSEYHVER